VNRPRVPAWARSLRFRLALRWSLVLSLIATLVVVGLNVALARAVGDPPDATTYRAVEKVFTGSGYRTVREFELGVVEEIEAVTTARTLDTLRVYSGIALGGLFLTSLLVGWLLAGRALRPVHQMTQEATRVNARDLSRRMSVQGDDEIGSLGRSIDEMLDRLDESFAQQRQFIDDASHELRTPLAVIRTNVDAVLDRSDVDVADRRTAIAAMRRAVGRMTTLVDDLLASARASAPEELLDVLALDELARDEVAEHAEIADAHDVEVSVRSEPVQVRGHGLALRRAVDNLLANAIRHSDAGARVTVDVGAAPGGWAFLAVTDTGPGLSGTDAAQVFQRFWRADGQSSHDGHSGLGLAIVRQVAESHGGLARVHSRLGAGSTFVLWLPTTPFRRPEADPPPSNPVG
jgi:signal transduction histidine kinase